MKLKWIESDSLVKEMKASIHLSGKLGFGREAAKGLKLELDKSARIAINIDDEEDQNLYMKISNTSYAKGNYKISRAGKYFYINTKALFDSLKIDYTINNVSYDISVHKEDETLYVLKQSVTKRRVRTIKLR